MVWLFTLISFWPVFELHSVQEVSQNLILAKPIMCVTRFSEECTQFVFAQFEIHQLEYSEHVVVLQVERYFEFAENAVVRQTFLRRHLWPIFSTTLVNYETVQENS